MKFKNPLHASSLAGYGKAIREAPREVIFNRNLLLSSLVYAFGGFPVSKLAPTLSRSYLFTSQLVC